MFALASIRTQVVSRVAVRGFSATAASKKDFLQDLYLKEIRGYKADPKASKADVTTKEFVAPKAAQAPKSDIDLEADIKSYEKNGVISQ